MVAAYEREAEHVGLQLAQAALVLSALPYACSPSQPATARILDVCAGTGVLTFAALPFIAHSTCTDFASGMVDAAGDRARRMGVEHRVTAEVRDCTDLSAYGDDTFDAAFCHLALFMLPAEAQQQAVREMHRVVKPGGCVVIANWGAVERSHFHTLMFGCMTAAAQAKSAAAAFTAPSPADTAPGASAPAAAAGQPRQPAVTFSLATEEANLALLAAAPFASSSAASQLLRHRCFLTPLDFWLSVKGFLPMWRWSGDVEERRGDEAAVAWLATATGGQAAFAPTVPTILAMGRK